MLMRDMPLETIPPGERRLRETAATLLQLASRTLESLAQRLALAEAPQRADEALFEYHGDASAPEGALYVNGQLVGHVLGVTRL